MLYLNLIKKKVPDGEDVASVYTPTPRHPKNSQKPFHQQQQQQLQQLQQPVRPTPPPTSSSGSSGSFG